MSRPGALTTGRTGATVTWLSNGKVLAAGGYDESHTLLAAAAILDPVAGTWTPADRLSIPRASPTATRLSNGIGVLIAGGIDALGPSASSEIFHPMPELPYEASRIRTAVMGRATAIAENSHQHLFVSFEQDDGRSRIYEYRNAPRIVHDIPPLIHDGTGVQQFGEPLDGSVHTLGIDKADNVWAVVEKTNTIVKFGADARVLMRLFPPPEPPDP